MLVIVAWVVTLEALSLGVWPLARHALPGAVDGGWAASRVLASILLGLVVGGAASLRLLPYTPDVILAVAAVGASLIWLTLRPRGRWSRPSRAAWIGESIALGTFAAALGLRLLFPSVDDSERPMDFAFLSAFLRAETLPPVDPWFAGQPIAYYTFGYLSWADVARLAGAPAAVAYNLAVASVFSTAVALAWATAASVRGRLNDGLLAATAFALVGNLRTFVDWLIVIGIGMPAWWASWATSQAGALPAPGWASWSQASRVIPNGLPDGITEFPYFGLIVGNLHPHYMAMPTNILALALAFAALRGAPLRLLMLLGAATLASLAAGNTWDVPAATALIGLASVARFCWPRLRPLLAVGILGALLGLSALMATPLLLGLSTGPLSLAFTPASARLWPGTFAVLFLPYALAVSAVLVADVHAWRGWRPILCAWAGVCVAAEVLVQAGVAALLTGAIVALAVVAARAYAAGDSPRAGLLATCGLAIGLILVPEFVFLSDYFGTRMNTVFKFYFQALILLAVALPPLLSRAPLGSASSARRRSMTVLRRVTFYAFALTLLYVPLAPFTRMGVSPAGGSLDALAFLQTHAPGDLATIRWLGTIASPGTVILEAADRQDPLGVERSMVSRISAFSGIPTPVGWPEHEQQWRGRITAIDQRLRQVGEVYRDAPRAAASQILANYHISYVVVGPTERKLYGPSVDERFTGWLEPAFQSGETRVYRVPDDVETFSGPPEQARERGDHAQDEQRVGGGSVAHERQAEKQ